MIATSDVGRDARVAGADRRVVLYHSTSVTGRDIAVSGVVFVPAGPAPRGGWPVVSWAHGTTGMADRCAPSELPNLYYNEYAQVVRAFVTAGYAVAATDYPGLGTPGTHSYLIGVDEGNSVVDIVTAAHQLGPQLSPGSRSDIHKAARPCCSRREPLCALPRRLSAQQVTRLSAELGRDDDPDNASTVGPVVVIQGATDQDVSPVVTQLMVQHLHRLGADVTERVYPGRNHDAVVGPSLCDQLAWMTSHSGRPATPCTPQPSER